MDWYRNKGFEAEEHTCEFCGEAFLVPECAGELHKTYCSPEHQEKGEHGTQSYKCDWCGDNIEGQSTERFCSPICEAKFNLDKKYNLDEFNWRKIRYDLDYLAKAKTEGRNIITKKCENCKEKFLVPSRKNDSVKYCSEKCRIVNTKRYGTYPYVIFYRDNFRCRYCGRKPIDGIKLTIDHVYPQSEGGGNDLLNLVTSCQRCNSHKNATLWDEKLIKQIWRKNYKLNEEIESKSYDKMRKEFLSIMDKKTVL